MAVVGSSATVAHASAPSLAPVWTPVARFRNSDGAGVVIDTDPSLPTSTVCVAPSPDDPPSANALELARHGGTWSRERVDDVEISCASAPAEETAFLAAWVGRVQHAAPRNAAKPRNARDESLAMLERIAIEGATHKDDTTLPPWVLTVVGPKDAADVVGSLAAVMGTLAPASSVRPPQWTYPQTTERLSVIHGDLTAPAVRYGWVLPVETPKDRATLAVALETLGGVSGRLPRLVSRRGLARHVEAWSVRTHGRELAGFWVEATTRVSLDRVRRFVDGAIRRLRLTAPMPREFARVKALLLGNALRRFEHPEKRARELTRSELEDGDASTFTAEIDALERVTRDSVRLLLHDMFSDARRTTVEVYPHSWPLDDPSMARHTLYTVERGDTLTSIAARFHVQVAALARGNDLAPTHLLSPGQPLWIPPSAGRVH